MLARIALLLILAIPGLATRAVQAAPTVTGPATASVGSEVTVTVVGSGNPLDFVTIVPKAMREGGYDAYQYVSKPGPLKLTAPATPGDYEIRLLAAASPYPTLARQTLRLEAVAAQLEAPAQVAAGATFPVRWTGPGNPRDYVGIGNASRPYISYLYTRAGNPLSLTAPDVAGEYELRYFLAQGDTVIGSRPITVGGVTATVAVPPRVAAGARFPVKWTGPANPRDFITVVKAGTPAGRYGPYTYTSAGSPLELRAPDEAGDYEVRYLTAQSYATLGSAPLTVTPNTASLQGPAEAVAGSRFPVKWQGPDNVNDYVTIVAPDAKEGTSGNYAYTARGTPASLLAPLESGDYELRYSTGQSHATLARAPIRITPGKVEPGFVLVTAAATAPKDRAVEVVLDASGSMLQRIGNERRIDIAKRTLTRLTSAEIPAGTPFALRVFGREVDSCQTDLEMPLAPLDARAVGARIASLEAKNNARTPIGASLDKVADDLRAAKGARLVILLTDGEETCGGDAAQAIAKLRKAGTDVRVNIVGFAIDDERLAATFRHWADTGGGSYFDTQDAAGLDKALALALQPLVELVNADGQVVAEILPGSAKVPVMPGTYSVRIAGQAALPQPVTVRPGETTTVKP